MEIGRNEIANWLIDFLLKIEMHNFITPRYGRVPTLSNVADEPSRGEVWRLLQKGAAQRDPSNKLVDILTVLRENTVM